MPRSNHYNVQKRDRDRLTPRQREVVELMARGRTNGQVAEELGITIDGAKFHVGEILERLGVSSREEAVAVWRRDGGPNGRARRMGAAIGSGAFAVALAGAVGVVVVAFALSPAPGVPDDRTKVFVAGDEVSVGAVVAAATEPGTVVYVESVHTRSGQPGNHTRTWYSADLRSSRVEARTQDQDTTSVTVPGRRVIAISGSNQYSDVFVASDPADPLDPALRELTHVALLRDADRVSYGGVEVAGVLRLHRFDTERVLRSHELAPGQVPGTVERATIHVRDGDLLPTRISFEYSAPGLSLTRSQIDVTVAYVLPLDDLQAGLFDADLLVSMQASSIAEVGPLVSLAGPRFWLGPWLNVPASGGTTSTSRQTIVAAGFTDEAEFPGATATSTFIAYGRSGSEGARLVELHQAIWGSLDVLSVERRLAASSGNLVRIASKDASVFVVYVPIDGCSLEQAQVQPECREPSSGVWGAELERDGTEIVLAATRVDGNPFSSSEAMLELLRLLRRLN